ncbi:hypothetical protein [Paenibacillus amylolyticus]|uniref:Uncharacterized protein n=1 Tax=Paenibacillus amylolyticus TaxID=1451 RepID=A0A100VMA9_PAEAM|nr:hypothetical protein [Paenibacillus amylolyticus]GAS82404.1 unknown protein [Paenibacillus amylolyticus]
MSKVFVHTHTAHDSDWKNDYHDFSRVPIEGEVFALSSDSPWYQVELVVHTPFEKDLAAEVYAVEVDHSKIKRNKLNIEPAIEFK